jgi:hypothetical protein
MASIDIVDDRQKPARGLAEKLVVGGAWLQSSVLCV